MKGWSARRRHELLLSMDASFALLCCFLDTVCLLFCSSFLAGTAQQPAYDSPCHHGTVVDCLDKRTCVLGTLRDRGSVVFAGATDVVLVVASRNFCCFSCVPVCSCSVRDVPAVECALRTICMLSNLSLTKYILLWFHCVSWSLSPTVASLPNTSDPAHNRAL